MVLALVKEQYWNSLETFTNEYYKKTSDPLYIFRRAFAQYNLGNPNAAINDLLSIQQKKEIAYACIVALLYYQGKARNTDRVIRKLDSKKSITSEPEKERKDVMLLIEPSLMPFTFLYLWEKPEKLETSFKKKELQVTSE